MQSDNEAVIAYINKLPKQRVEYFNKLRATILLNLPKGFVEEINYGMIGYVVPHNIYPDGYHCDPHLPLTFINIASKKEFIAFYHMGIYLQPELLQWFVRAYAKIKYGQKLYSF